MLTDYSHKLIQSEEEKSLSHNDNAMVSQTELEHSSPFKKLTYVPATVCNEQPAAPLEPNAERFTINAPTEREARKAYLQKIIRDYDLINYLIRYRFNFYMRYGYAYTPLNESMFQNAIYNYGLRCGIQLSTEECRYISSHVQLHTPDYLGVPDAETYTLFQNGYVDNQTGVLVGNVPSYFPTIWVTGNYVTDRPIYHPQMDAFLATLFDNDPILIARAWEIIGYCISSDAKAKRFFIFPGPSGDNGKTTFTDLLDSLLSDNAVGALSMKNLLSGRFSLSELYLKRISISSDEGTLNLDNDKLAVLKRISGHDHITADVKFQRQTTFLSTCKIIIASNHDIGLSYTASDSAVMRRICTLPFNVKIPREQQNADILQSLKLEKDDIITEAFCAYLRLRQRNYVFTGDNMGYDDYKSCGLGDETESHLIAFCEKYCDYSRKDAFTFTQDLYSMFQKLYGNEFADATAFSQAFDRTNARLCKTVQKVRRHTAQRNAWGFKGITLR